METKNTELEKIINTCLDNGGVDVEDILDMNEIQKDFFKNKPKNLVVHIYSKYIKGSFSFTRDGKVLFIKNNKSKPVTLQFAVDIINLELPFAYAIVGQIYYTFDLLRLIERHIGKSIPEFAHWFK